MLQHPHLFLRQWPPHPTGEVLLGEAGIVGSVELDDFVAEMLEDATDETVLAGVNFNLHFALREAFNKMEAVGLDRAVFKGDAFADLLHVLEGKILVKGDEIYLRHFIAWMREFFGEFAVIGEQDKA